VSRAVHERPAPDAVAPRPRRGGAAHLDGRELGAIFAGGFVGAAARAELGELLPHGAGGWPWATLLVNVAGAFLLGYAVTRLQERLPLSVYRRPFLGTGVCGGLTTFSTMQVELLQMLDAGRIGLALAYALVSVLAGFVGVAVATNLVRRTRLTA
jgi:fluoride exporter